MNVEHNIVLGIGASQDEAISRHFGEKGPPQDGVIVVRKYTAVLPRRDDKPMRRVTRNDRGSFFTP